MRVALRSYCSAAVVLTLFLVGCATKPEKPELAPVRPPEFTGLKIEDGPSSLGCEPRKAPVTILILHHTAGSLPSSLDKLQGKDPKHKVGIHYVVTDELRPRVIRMVPESMAAYHAGKSAWGRHIGLNQHSIGIEVINYDGNVYGYSEAQAEVLFALCSEIIRRHDLRPWNVVGHSDVSVGRKVDPGSKFPWPKLAALGVGAWPLGYDVKTNLSRELDLSPGRCRTMLKAYGYAVEPGDAGLKHGVEAFQRHFRPGKVDGVIDRETVALLEALLRRYPETSSAADVVRP